MVQDPHYTDTIPPSQGNERVMASLFSAFLKPWKLVELSWSWWEAVGKRDGLTQKAGGRNLYIDVSKP